MRPDARAPEALLLPSQKGGTAMSSTIMQTIVCAARGATWVEVN